MGERPAGAKRHGKHRRYQEGTMVNVKQVAHSLLVVLVLLSGLVGVLLWRRAVTGWSNVLSGSIPYAPNYRLIVSVSRFNYRLHANPSYPDGYDSGTLDRPNELSVHLWTQDTNQHTFPHYSVFR